MNKLGDVLATGGYWFRLRPLLWTLFSYLFAGATMAIEEPNYQVITTAENLELRLYEPRILAQTLVSGTMDNCAMARCCSSQGHGEIPEVTSRRRPRQ